MITAIKKLITEINFLRRNHCNLFKITVINILIIAGIYDYAYCFNVSQGRIEISVAPSKDYEGVLIVRNTEERDLLIKLRIEDWHKAVEGVRKGKSAEFNWLEISPREFELKEGETKEVKIEVRVPKKANGELNGMIFVDGSPKEIKEGAIGINTSIGIPIYVMVKGTEKFRAEVEDLKVIATSPLELAVTIKNLGNVHIRPTGTIEIINADVIARTPEEIPRLSLRGAKHRSNLKTGSEQAPQSLNITVPLNEYNYPILPNSSRTLEIRTNKGLEAGEYIADIKMGYGDRRYRKKIILKIQDERG